MWLTKKKKVIKKGHQHPCCDLSLQGNIAGQTKTMQATVTVQLLTFPKFVKLKQRNHFTQF